LNKNFFWPEFIEEIEVQKKKRLKSKIEVNNDPCEICGLYKTVKSPKLGIRGQGKLGIVYLGESQGENEDKQGTHFVGQAGARIRRDLKKLGLDLDQDFYKLNAVRCRPTTEKGSNRTPDDREIAYCADATWKIIEELKPKAIWLAGRVPLQSYLLKKISGKASVNKWRGCAIPDQELGCWVLPMYHPSYPMRSPKDKALANLFFRDLERALQKSQQPVPKYNAEKYLRILKDPKEIIACLTAILKEKPKFLVVDFETTGLKPHGLGHNICYCSFAKSREWAISFPMKDKEVRELVVRILEHPDIGMGGHNIKYEDTWSKIILGADVSNWVWCSQIATHILDDRQEITSLGFQVAARYGDFHFKNDTEPYLEGGKKASQNAINRISECPEALILKRCGLDSLYEYWLAEDQWKEFEQEHSLINAYKLFHAGTLAFADTEQEGGMCVDTAYLEWVSEDLECRLTALESEIKATTLAKQYEDRHGSQINPGSDVQLRKVLFDCAKIKPVLLTDNKNPKVNHKVLESLTSHKNAGRFCELVMNYRKLSDLKGTFVSGVLREAVNHTDLEQHKLKVVYPNLNLHIPRSYRSSSSGPNFQNFPEHDEESKMILQRGFYPWPGHCHAEVDYGGMEVKIAACYTKDRELIRYIKDRTSDIHRDQAIELYMLDFPIETWKKDKVLKQLRYLAKNCFIFPEFYGSWYMPCGENLWNNAKNLVLPNGVPFLDHMASKGINQLDIYQGFVKSKETEFWRKFKGYATWKEEWVEQYLRTGKVPMFHGFRRQHLLNRNMILNTAIQGTAYHCLQWSYNKINEIRKEEKWKTKLIGQVHDSIKFSSPPEELDYIVELSSWVMTQAIKEPHNWLIVPLEVEWAVGNQGSPWAMKKPI